MKRELNDMEYLNFSLGQPHNIAVVLKIKGNLPVDSLTEALTKAQQRHPLLKVRIE
jgi:hypothetical protein